MTHAEALAVRVCVELLTRNNIMTIEVTATLSQWDTAILEGKSYTVRIRRIIAVPAVTWSF